MENTVDPRAVAKMISYFYLVSFCPPEYVGELKKASKKMRERLAELAGISADKFTDRVIPEAAMRIVAYNHATRKPDEDVVKQLADAMVQAEDSPESAAAFQSVMKDLAGHPGRAKAANRLHKQKGCDFCLAPCRFGFYTLMSEPNLKLLKEMLDAENQKIAEQRDAVRVFWTYTKTQIWQVLEAEDGIIKAEALGNLSYCLLMLGTAKSRFALPETQLKMYQIMNQLNIRRLGKAPILLKKAA